MIGPHRPTEQAAADQLSASVTGELTAGLRAVCAEAGLKMGNARLIKYTMNAVYTVDDVVIRLAQGDAAKDRARQLVPLMEPLHRAGAPVIRLTTGIKQPVESGPWVGTVWQRVFANPTPPEPISLATPLRRLHTLTAGVLATDTAAPEAVNLPKWAPVEKTLARIATAQNLPKPESDATRAWARRELGISLEQLTDWLTAATHELAHGLATIDWALPAGPIHSDAHTGNLLLTPSGEGLLCDLDGITHGPREWDLVPSAHGVERFGRPHPAYQQFADAYGFDITNWSGWPVLRTARDLQLVTSVLPSLTGRPTVQAELGQRLRSLLDPATPVIWKRYI